MCVHKVCSVQQQAKVCNIVCAQRSVCARSAERSRMLIQVCAADTASDLVRGALLCHLCCRRVFLIEGGERRPFPERMALLESSFDQVWRAKNADNGSNLSKYNTAR